MNHIQILGVRIDVCSESEACEYALDLARSGEVHFVVTPNAEILRRANINEKYRCTLNASALSLPDGIGVVGAARLSGVSLSRIAGVDFGARIMSEAAATGMKVYLLGGKAGVAERAADKLSESAGVGFIAGTHHGFFDDPDDVIKSISAVSPNIVIVCLGAPRQEMWVYENRHRLPPALYICLGGSIDVYSGDVARAPRSVQKAGLEWAWRIAREPARIRRAGALPMFVLDVLRANASLNSGKKSKKSSRQ